MLTAKLTTLVVLVAALCGAGWASIENEPVKVTYRNSGPRYDIDDVERTRVSPDARDNQLMGAGRMQPAPTDQESEQPPMGHISIRRIFLVPMMQPAHSEAGWSQAGDPERPAEQAERTQSGVRDQPGMFGAMNSNNNQQRQPFWPFMLPTRHHLLGGDEASRSPTPEASNERPSASESQEQPGMRGEREEQQAEHPRRLLIDPIQLIMEMMQHALNPAPTSSFFNDLNKEASGSPKETSDKAAPEAKPTSELAKPSSKNETKEEIVEIEGKKYLRKTVINRHVGENIIFMTKRLIFVPLNETDSSTESQPNSSTLATQTSPETPASSPSPPEPESSTSGQPSEVSRKVSGEASTERATSAPSSTEPAASKGPIVPISEQPTTTSEQVAPQTTQAPAKEETTAKSREQNSWIEKASEAVERSFERLQSASSTPKPSATQ